MFELYPIILFCFLARIIYPITILVFVVLCNGYLRESSTISFYLILTILRISNPILSRFSDTMGWFGLKSPNFVYIFEYSMLHKFYMFTILYYINLFSYSNLIFFTRIDVLVTFSVSSHIIITVLTFIWLLHIVLFLPNFHNDCFECFIILGSILSLMVVLSLRNPCELFIISFMYPCI